jgi:hypothetical protein
MGRARRLASASVLSVAEGEVDVADESASSHGADSTTGEQARASTLRARQRPHCDGATTDAVAGDLGRPTRPAGVGSVV